MKKSVSLLLALCLLLSLWSCGARPTESVPSETTQTLTASEGTPLERLIGYLFSSEGAKDLPGLYRALAENAGTSFPDWVALALARTGRTEGMEIYRAALRENVVTRYKNEDKLSRNLATEWHRIGLCLLALGDDPRNVEGIDLAADGVWDRGRVSPLTSQGCNGVAWALTFLGAGGYAVPEGAAQSKEELIRLLLEAQHEDGGWVFGNFDSDADTTAMALTGLSRFRGEPGVDEAIEKGLNLLSRRQLEDGGFESFGSKNPMSISQVILALTALELDPATDPRFQKEGGDPVDALLAYQLKDGSFPAKAGDTKAGGIANYQAFLALAALELAGNGQHLFERTEVRG